MRLGMKSWKLDFGFADESSKSLMSQRGLMVYSNSKKM